MKRSNLFTRLRLRLKRRTPEVIDRHYNGTHLHLVIDWAKGNYHIEMLTDEEKNNA